MANKTMKTLTIGNNTYEIYDEVARNDIENLKESAITIDDTLAVSGSAADAKVTGDAIDNIETQINNINTIVGDKPVHNQIKEYAVAKAGDAMTGTLTTPFITIKSNSGNMYPGMTFRATDQEQNSGQINFNATNRRFYVTEKCLDTDFSEVYFLPSPSNERVASGSYNILTNKSAVTISQGGTDATTQLEALKNITNASGDISHVTEIYPQLSNLGLVSTSCTTEELVKAMQNNSSICFTHNKDWSIKLTDAPTNYGFIVLYRGYNNNYCHGWCHGYDGKVYVYKWHGSNTDGLGWKQVYHSNDKIPHENVGIVYSETEPTDATAGQIWLKPI